MISAAAPLHASVLAALHVGAFLPGEAWTEDSFAQQLVLPGVFGLIAAEANAPIGFILARAVGGEAEILTLAVLPRWRRKGYARALLRAAMDRAAAEGALTMFLEVATVNDAAAALYRSAGFVPVGLRRGYYAPGQDALVLRAAITGGGSESA